MAVFNRSSGRGRVGKGGGGRKKFGLIGVLIRVAFQWNAAGNKMAAAEPEETKRKSNAITAGNPRFIHS